MTRCFVLFALKKSGQHGVINWICSQTAPAIHYNNCGWVLKKGKQPERFLGNDPHVFEADGKRVKLSELTTPQEDYNVALYNFEDRTIGDRKKKIFDELGKKYDDITFIVVIRDPLNLFASRRQVKIKINMWSKYDEHLNHYLDDKNPVIGISFNKWFLYRAYRESIAIKLGIPFTDAGLNMVTQPGCSSFDKIQYDGKAQQMTVLDRWRKEKLEQLKKEVGAKYFEIADKHFDIVVP